MWVRAVIGLVMVAIGGVWFAQGTGALGGSFMSGQTLWTIIGAVVVVIGLLLIVSGARARPTPLDD